MELSSQEISWLGLFSDLQPALDIAGNIGRRIDRKATLVGLDERAKRGMGDDEGNVEEEERKTGLHQLRRPTCNTQRVGLPLCTHTAMANIEQPHFLF